MTTLVLKLMKSKFAAAGAVLIVALIIILMGPRIGLVRPYNFILAVLVLLGWLAWLGYQKLQAKKNASALEGFLNQQADDQRSRRSNNRSWPRAAAVPRPCMSCPGL
jgi:threonine/homoserine/homoserine lactone efflux protein